MKGGGLWQLVRANPVAVAASVLLHVLVVILLSISLMSSEVHRPKAPPETQTVKAVVVDANKVQQEIEKRKREEEQKRQQEIARKQQLERDAEAARKKLEREKRELAELKKKQQQEKERVAKEQERLRKLEAERQRQAELEQQREAERIRAEEQQRAEQERQRKLEAERRAEEERARKAEAERKRKEEEARQKRLAEEAEKKRLAEEAEKKRLAEEAERRRQAEEAELKRRLEEEARRQEEYNRKLDVLRMQYVKLIEQKVASKWLRPPGSSSQQSCEVYVRQTVLGDVTSVRLQDCAANVAFQNSIERAVRAASPLPPPPNPDVFDNEIHFTFRPQS